VETQLDQARRFADLHVKGDLLILYNIWDAGGAQALQEAGAKAIATGSASVAAAHGFQDGEKLPLELALANLRRIVAAVDLPVTIDFEAGYGQSPEVVANNVLQVIEAGAVGINFEDQVIGGSGLYPMEEQRARIAAIRQAAEQASLPLFINARTDIFLKADPATHDHRLLEEAASRAAVYAESGASGFFAPGLRDAQLIEQLCALSTLPVNIMSLSDAPSLRQLAELGVARISYGPFPYRHLIEALKAGAQEAFAPFR
jgi:2-methylisocitrate lyase-like PEP mutase family enzyme